MSPSASGIDRYGPKKRDYLPSFVVGPHYGDFGRGDDTQCIANTIDAAAQAGGGRVVIPGFPSYVIKASQVIHPRFIHITGSWDSKGASGNPGRIQQLSGVNDDFWIFADTGVSGTTFGPFVGPLSLSELTITGTLGSTSGHGICSRKPDGTVAGIQDVILFQNLHLRRWAKSAMYFTKVSPLIVTNVVTEHNGGYGIEIIDTGTDTNTWAVNQVVLTNIAGDANMGYQSDNYGATVYVKGMNKQFGLSIRGVKSENRIRPVDDGGDGVGMGNAHAVILENCADTPVNITGVTHISTGDQSRRPGPAIRIIGPGRPNLQWSAVGIRNSASSQTTGAVNPQVRDDILSGDYFQGHGSLGAETDAQLEFTSGEATMNRRDVTVVSVATGNGTLRLTYFTAKRSETVNTMRIVGGSTAAVGATLVRAGIYEVAASGSLTLLAGTANDTTVLATASTSYSRALSTTVSKKRGTRYALGLLVVGSTTAPTMSGQSALNASETAVEPRVAAIVTTSQTDLPATVATSVLGNTGLQQYLAVSGTG